MKIRKSFVSNSSSTAFVVMFPENSNIFDLWCDSNDRYCEQYDITEDDCIKVHEILIKDREVWFDSYHSECQVLIKFYRDSGFIIGGMDVSSDCGQFALADMSKVKKILRIN